MDYVNNAIIDSLVDRLISKYLKTITFFIYVLIIIFIYEAWTKLKLLLNNGLRQ